MYDKYNFYYPIFFSVLFLSFSFTMQVFMHSALPALINYLFLGYALLRSPSNNFNTNFFFTVSAADLVLSFFIFMALFNSLWQLTFEFITPTQFLNSIVICLLPFSYYIFFCNSSNFGYLKTLLWGIAIAGLINGVYGIYESVGKFNGVIQSYANAAHWYSIERMGQSMIDSNNTRISLSGRSMGLLEKHTISAAWISFGCFAALALSSNKKYLRIFILIMYGGMLLILYNGTSIIAFGIVVCLFEYNLYTIFMGFLRKKSINSVLCGICLAGLIVFMGTNFEIPYVDRYLEVLITQKEIIMGSSNVAYLNEGYFGSMFNSAVGFFKELHERPNIFFFGQGFSFSYGVDVGGDFGIIETLYLLGLPLFILIVTGLFFLLAKYIKLIGGLNRSRQFLIMKECKFALSIIVYVLLTEIHYSIWYTKSIFPIFLVALSVLLTRKKLHRHQSEIKDFLIAGPIAKNLPRLG